MGSMENGTLFIRTEKLEETADHISRLSIRMILGGEQWYNVGGVDHKLNKDNFLVIDQGQHYRTAFTSATDQAIEMAVVAFRPGMAEEVWRSLSATTEQLLDDPQGPIERIGFFEHTHAMDDLVRSTFVRLQQMVNSGKSDPVEAAAYHDRLMEHLIAIQKGIIRKSESIQAVRRSTRLEIWRRLNRARDLMEACYADRLPLAELARTACLSEHHFKRLFKQAFGMPPHKYLVAIRMLNARRLIGQGFSVASVPQLVGFMDVSAFVRAYRQFHGTTPGMHAPD